MGRKPLPLALRLLKNTARPRLLNPPTHEALDPTCPEELVDPVARGEWARVASVLSDRGHCTAVDRVALLGYCLKYAQWRALEDEARKHPFVVKAPSGYPVPNPAVGMANRVFNLLLKASAELGLTPSSRTRVVAAQNADHGDDFTRFQHRRHP